MASVSVAASPAPEVSLPTAIPTHVTAESIEKLTAGLLAIAKTNSVTESALLTSLANQAQPLPLNRLDSFGAGTIVNTRA
jgi:hypothetical protein